MTIFVLSRSGFQRQLLWMRQETVSDLDERRSYAKLCTALITLAPTVAAKYELDNRLWKVCFYPCIESIRAYLQTSSGPSAVSVFAKASWASLIGVAVQTFAQLLASTHRNRISSSDTKQSPSMPSYSKFVGWIGDLGRYRAIFDVDPSTLNLTIQLDILKGWYRAKHVYSVASLLAPSNGQYYYHLAVFDLNLSQTLSSLCYFIRALNVKVPYPSAHDSIVSLCLGNRAIYNESIKSTGRQKHRGGSGGGAKTKQSPPQDSESVESILVRAFEILYTRINLDRLSSILEKLNTSLSKSDDSAASNGELPTEFFQYSILLLISLLSAPDKLDESGAVSQIRLGCFQVFKVLWRAIVLRLSLDESVCSITSVDALVAFRLIISWLCCSSALECFLTTESVVALELEWGQLAALARNYKVSSGPLETPGRVLFPEDWRYRGFVPLKDVYPRKRFDVHIKGSGGSLLDMCPSLESFSAHPERVAAVKNEIWAALNVRSV
ncbi:hypothetical protein BDR26DRAFT_122186 [Obelidium mucronatum]|nr:hypothetical protein BDR26DRAFT_122186 [Obelidium mucronatum]